MSKRNRRTAPTATEAAGSGYLYIIKGLLGSVVLSLIVMLIGAAICTFFIPTDFAAKAAAYLCCFAGTFFSGMYISAHVNKRGLVKGALSGILYSLVIILAGAAVCQGFPKGSEILVSVVISLCGGAAGGVAGINVFH